MRYADPDCRKCGGTGWLLKAGGVGVRCGCKRDRGEDPRRFGDYGFDPGLAFEDATATAAGGTVTPESVQFGRGRGRKL